MKNIMKTAIIFTLIVCLTACSATTSSTDETVLEENEEENEEEIEENGTEDAEVTEVDDATEEPLEDDADETSGENNVDSQDDPFAGYELLTYEELSTREYLDYDYCFDIIVDKINVSYYSYNSTYTVDFTYWYKLDDTYTRGDTYSSGITEDDVRYVLTEVECGDVVRFADTTLTTGIFSTSPSSDSHTVEIVDYVDIESVYANVRVNYPDMSAMYEDIERNPDNYASHIECYITGTIVQVVEEDDYSVEYRVETENGYVYVFWYDAEELRGSRLLEDDVVTIYGTTSGLTTYTTVLGVEKQVPELTVFFIDLN